MNLHNNPFEAVKRGTKTIEMRLNDEKRRRIKIGDLIEFVNTSTQEMLKVEVRNLYRYKDFEELYSHHDKVSIGYALNEVANYQDMQIYYNPSDILKNGVLAIEIKLLF